MGSPRKGHLLSSGSGCLLQPRCKPFKTRWKWLSEGGWERCCASIQSHGLDVSKAMRYQLRSQEDINGYVHITVDSWNPNGRLPV